MATEIQTSDRISIKNFERVFGEEGAQELTAFPMVLVHEIGNYEIIEVSKVKISEYVIVSNIPQEDIHHSTEKYYNFVIHQPE